MKRRDILSLRILSKSSGEKKGFVKELMLVNGEFRLSHFIINDNTLENTFILPIEKAIFEDGHIFISDDNDMQKIDRLQFYNEMIRNEAHFVEKNIVEEDKVLGKAIDYSFNIQNGELEEVLFIDTEKGCISSVESERIIKNTEDSIIISKIEEVPVLKPEDLEIYYDQLNIIINDFRFKVEEEHRILEEKYKEIEKEIISEFDNFIVYMKNKRETFFNVESLSAKERFLDVITNNSEEAKIEMQNIDLNNPKKVDDKVCDLKEILNKKNNVVEENKVDEDIEEEKVNLEEDKELQKLFELQRKRADIINKL